MTKVGAAAGGVGASIVAGFKPAFDALGEQSRIADAADAFGLTGAAASRLFGIMAAGGSDIRDATEGLVTFNQRVSDALSGTGEEAAKLFQDLGVSAEAFANLDTGARFFRLVDALRAVADPAKRVQLLLKSVGEDTGKSLIPLLSMSADEVNALGDALGSSSEDLNAAREATRAYTLAMAQVGKVWRDVATAVAPVVKDFAEQVGRIAKPISEVVTNNRQLVAGLLMGSAALVAGGVALVSFGAGLGGLGALGVSALAIVKAIGAAAGALLSPLGLTAAALAGIGYLLATQTSTGASAFDSIKTAASSFASYVTGAFNTVMTVGSEAWGGIVAAILKGDLQAAGEIALAALEVLFEKTTAELTGLWNGFGSRAVEAWHELTDGMGELLQAAWEICVEVFDGIWEAASSAFTWIWDKVSGVVEQIKAAWNGLSETWKMVVGGLLAALSPVVAPIVAVVAAIEKAWEGMSGNIMENLNTFAAWAKKVYVDVKAAIVNTFNAVARSVLTAAINTAKGLEALTPGDKWKKIREELEGMRGGLTDINADAEKRAIDAERDRLNEQLRKDREAAKKAREAARADDAKAADARAAEAEKRLKDLAAKAKELTPKLDFGGGGDFGEMAAGAAKAATIAGSSGTFTAAMSSQRLGGQTVGQKQLGKLNDINNGVRDLNRNVKDVGKKLEFK